MKLMKINLLRTPLKLILIVLLMQKLNLRAQDSPQKSTLKFDDLFTVVVNKPIIVSGELELVFSGHSHKISSYPDPSAPLLINMQYKNLINNKPVLKTEYVVASKLPYLWRWKEYLFLVTKYEYNESMEIKVCRDNYSE